MSVVLPDELLLLSMKRQMAPIRYNPSPSPFLSPSWLHPLSYRGRKLLRHLAAQDESAEIQTSTYLLSYILLALNDRNEAQGQPTPENPPSLFPVASILLLSTPFPYWLDMLLSDQFMESQHSFMNCCGHIPQISHSNSLNISLQFLSCR